MVLAFFYFQCAYFAPVGLLFLLPLLRALSGFLLRFLLSFAFSLPVLLMFAFRFRLFSCVALCYGSSLLVAFYLLVSAFVVIACVCLRLSAFAFVLLEPALFLHFCMCLLVLACFHLRNFLCWLAYFRLCFGWGLRPFLLVLLALRSLLRLLPVPFVFAFVC